MRFSKTASVILIVTFATAARSMAQFYPELSFPLSAAANAMGGAGASLVSQSPSALSFNPAQLGLSSLDGIMSAAIVPGVNVSPNYTSLYGAWYLTGLSRDFAIDLGLPVSLFWHRLPFKLGIGIGYANARYPVGNASEGPYNLTRTDNMNDFTLSLGLKYVVTLGLGYTVDPLVSAYGGYPGSRTTTTTTHDLGAILRVPVLVMVSEAAHKSFSAFNDLKPLLDLTFGYSARNMGTHTYAGGAGLPAEADLGWNAELGLEMQLDHHEWRWISFTFVREADASLISLDSTAAPIPLPVRLPNSTYDYYYSYRKGLGDFHLFDNLVAGVPTAFDSFIYGRPAGNIGVLKGAQLELGQFIYLREGSVAEAGLPTYTTYGWGVKLDGLVKTLLFLHWLSPDGAFTRMLLDHFNFEYDYSKASGGPFQGEAVETLNLVIR